MLKKLTRKKKLLRENGFRHHLILVVFCLIFLFGLAVLLPAARPEPIPADAEMMFEKTANTTMASPGDRLNFSITYSNLMGETAYNVTVFEWMPTDLTLIGSTPFYDGASDPETGFYRWSRGNVAPGQGGTVVVEALVNNVPVGAVITNTAHLTYENGVRVEVTSSADVAVTQAAGVEVYPDQIHSVAPYTSAVTEYNITVKNTGNGADTFNISIASVAYNPSGASHEWTIELYDPVGYSQDESVATLYDDNLENRSSWTDHGVVADVTLASQQSTWYLIKVIEAEGTSGSGDAYLDIHFLAVSLFDPSVFDSADELAIVKSVAGITLAPDYLKYANPGEAMSYRHIVVNSGQTEVIDLNYTSPQGWSYSFWFDNETALMDTDGSGCVDIGVLPKNAYTYVVVKMSVPYSTPANINDTASVTATGVTSGNSDTVTDITVVKSAPVLGVVKTLVSANPTYQADAVIYTITISNLGNTRLTEIPVDDAFETSSLDFSGASPAEDEYDETAGTIRWETLSGLNPGQSIVITVDFVATAGDDTVRQSANVIDAADEFGSLISAFDMNKELAIIGAYSLTVTAAPDEALGGSFSATWVEHGTLKEGVFTTPNSITCDQDTTASVSSPESPITDGNVRHVFNTYLPSATVTMDSDKTVTLDYLTECTVTFEQIGSGEPVDITVESAQLPDSLPQSLWVLKDSTILFNYPSVLTDIDGTTRYVLTGVSGNTTDASITVHAPMSITGFYKTQYYLHVITDPEGLALPQSDGWSDHGTYAYIAVEPLTGGDGVSTQYRFDYWAGIDITNPSAPSTEILMDAPKTATAHFVKQYYVTVASLHDSPTPSQWVDRGDSFTASVVSPTEIVSSQTQWRCEGFIADGVVRVGTSHTFEDVQEPHIIEFLWVQQFWLQVDTTVGEATVEGTGWYDIGTAATLSATTPYQPAPSHQFTFESWTSTGSNEAAIADPIASGTTVTMDNYYNVQANWQEQWYITVTSPHDDPTPSQWVNTADSLVVSVTSPADNNDAGTRFTCVGYKVDDGELLDGTSYTFANVQAAHTIEFQWIAQFYLATATNLGSVSPDNGWYDAGSIVAIEATAPTLTAGSGYVWHGWTGTGTGSYSGMKNPATITMQGAINETAYWKVDPLVTIEISNDTIAKGDRILVYGQTEPIQSGVEILLIYQLPNGTRIEQFAYTDDDGYYEDTLFIEQDYYYSLLVNKGTWTVVAHRPSDILHENAQASTTLRVEARSASQIHPVLMAGAVLAVGLFIYAPPVKKLRNHNNGRRISLVLSLAGLTLGAVSLGLNWVSIAGTVTTLDATYEVDASLYPFSPGSVVLTNGLQYEGAEIPSLVHPSLASVRGNVGPLVTLYLIPVGCALALTGLYKPKNARQKLLKTIALTVSGLLMITAAVHTFMFVQGQTGAISGASIGFGTGLYLTVVSGALALLASLFATREKPNKSHARTK